MLKLYIFSAMLFAQSAFSETPSFDKNRRIYEGLSNFPESKLENFENQAEIVRYQERYYAIFQKVSIAYFDYQCAFASEFAADIGLTPGEYTFQTSFLCDYQREFTPAQGNFEFKFPTCPIGETCGHPALGVGNLIILPDPKAAIGKLPPLIGIKLFGQ